LLIAKNYRPVILKRQNWFTIAKAWGVSREFFVKAAKLFPKRRLEKVAPEVQLLMQKYALQMPNHDKPEITKYKHQITNKFQIPIPKSTIRSDANCLVFGI